MRHLIVGTVIALALLAGLWFWQRGSEPNAAGVPPVVTAEARSTAPESPVVALDAAPEREQAPIEGAGAARPVPSTARCIVTGRVVDSEGLAIAGAIVSLEPRRTARWSSPAAEGNWDTPELSAAYRRTETAADGRFRLQCAPPTCEMQQLRVQAQHCIELTLEFGPSESAGLPALGAEERDLGVLALTEGGAIRGQVVDPAGAPIAGAQVGVRATRVVQRWEARPTASDGRFGLDGLPAGEYQLRVEADGWIQKDSPSVRVESGGTVELDAVVLLRALTIRGVALDGSGAPAEQARIRAVARTELRSTSAETDEAGVFLLYVSADEAHTLSVSRSKLYEDWGGPTDPGAQARPGGPEVLVVLRRRPLFTFHVVDDRDGTPIERYGLLLRPKPEPNHFPSLDEPALADADHPGGDVALPASAQGQEVLVRAAGFAAQARDVREDSVGSARQTLRLRPEAALTGRALLRGAPLAAADVSVEGEVLDRRGQPQAHLGNVGGPGSVLNLFEGRRRSVRTDEAGRFRVGELAGGMYRLRITGSGSGEHRLRGLVVPAETVVELGDIDVAPGASIAGRVLTAAGRSAAGFQIKVGWITSREFRIADPQGEFRVEGLPAGEHQVHWKWPDEEDGNWFTGDPRSQKVTLAAGQTGSVTLDTRPFTPCDVGVELVRSGKPLADEQLMVSTHNPDGESTYSRVFGVTDRVGRVRGRLDGGLEFEFSLGAGFHQRIPIGERYRAIAGGVLELRIEVASGTLAVELPESFALPERGELQLVLHWGDSHEATRVAATPGSRPGHADGPAWTQRVHEFGSVPVGELEVRVKVERIEDDPERPGATRRVRIREPHTTRVTIRDGERTVVKVP